MELPELPLLRRVGTPSSTSSRAQAGLPDPYTIFVRYIEICCADCGANYQFFSCRVGREFLLGEIILILCIVLLCADGMSGSSAEIEIYTD